MKKRPRREAPPDTPSPGAKDAPVSRRGLLLGAAAAGSAALLAGQTARPPRPPEGPARIRWIGHS